VCNGFIPTLRRDVHKGAETGSGASAEENGEDGDRDDHAGDHAERVINECLSLDGLAVRFFPFSALTLLAKRQLPELDE
jgi:hypothetical protein